MSIIEISMYPNKSSKVVWNGMETSVVLFKRLRDIRKYLYFSRVSFHAINWVQLVYG